MKKKISVLMSVFNDEINVESSISGVLNQTYDNFELLIMDDCSTDSTKKIIKKYKDKDKRVKIFENSKNIGLTRSLNKLLNEAQGDLIARQDSDDLSLTQRFERQIEEIQSKDIIGCGTRAIIKDSSRVTPNKSYFIPKKIVMNLKNPFVHGSMMLFKNEVIELGGYDERFYYAQDFKLMTDLMLLNKKISILKEPLYVLNLKNNISTNFKSEQNYYAQCVKQRQIPKKLNVK